MANSITSNETDEQFGPAASVLKQFMTEMMEWEKRCHEDYKKMKIDADLGAKLAKDLGLMNDIFGTYCTPKTRTYNHVGTYGEPTEYDPSNEKIVDVIFETKKKIMICTQKELGAHVIFKYRYTLMKKGIGG